MEEIELGEAAPVRRSFASLPSRMMLAVCGAALFSSLVVTGLSSHMAHRFLRARLEEKFPAVAMQSRQRVASWFERREAELAGFAADPLLQGPLVARAKAPGEQLPAGGAAAARRLSDRLGRSPAYQALFLLDPVGRELVWQGRSFSLPADMRLRLAAVETPAMGRVRRIEGDTVQIASAPIRSAAGRRLGSLHGLLRIEALEAALDNDRLDDAGAIFLSEPGGEIVLRARGASGPARAPHELPTPGAGVAFYDNADGTPVIGAAVELGRFGWTLVVEEPREAALSPIGVVAREILSINLAFVVIFSFIAYQLAGSMARPIRELSERARRIAAGELDVTIQASARADEVGVLARALQAMLERLRRHQGELEGKNHELGRVVEVLRRISITDELTRLHNHRFFQNQLPREMKRAERTGEPLCLMLIDVDDFKLLNDRHGHAVGDAVLRRVADAMSEEIREMDLLARYGGEEFALLASQTPLDGAVALAQKIRLAVARARLSMLDLDSRAELNVTVSIGVALFRGDERAFFNDADRALYRAKESGKDCVVVADAVSDSQPGST